MKEDQDQLEPGDTLVLLNRAVDHLASFIGDSKFRYGPVPAKVLASIDGTFEALKIAQKIELQKHTLSPTTEAAFRSDVRSRLDQAAVSIESLRSDVAKLVNRREARKLVAEKLPKLVAMKLDRKPDPIPGIH